MIRNEAGSDLDAANAVTRNIRAFRLKSCGAFLARALPFFVLRYILASVKIFMSEIGIMKGFDTLGRIVIPKELCMRYALNGGTQNIATADGILLKNPEYIPVKQEKTLCRNADKR